MHIDVFDASCFALHCATQRGLGGGWVAFGAARTSDDDAPDDADGSGAGEAEAGPRGAHEAATQLPNSQAVHRATALAAFVAIDVNVAPEPGPGSLLSR